MEKQEKKSFLSRLLGLGRKTKDNGKRLYSNTKQTTTKIKLALLELLNTKKLSQISITNLVKVAGVYRATFYLHYKSLDDVIVDIERDVCDSYDNIATLMEQVDIYNNIGALITTIGEYIQADKKYLTSIINTQCFNRITLRLRALLQDIIISNFTQYGHMEDTQKLLNIGTFTAGVVFAYRDWISGLEVEFDEVQSHIELLAKTVLNLD